METKILPRSKILEILDLRDGLDCFYCHEPFNEDSEQLKVTIDHWIPLSKGGTWDISNLRKMHKKCNAIKADRMPNEDGTLPPLKREARTVSKAEKRAQRPDVCQRCESGRKLGPQESCGSCGSGPLPERWPRWAKVRPQECDHDEFWCWSCGSGLVERKPVAHNLLGL